VKQLNERVRNIFSIADFQKRYDDGRLQVKTLSGKVLEQKEAFPYGFKTKAKSGKVMVFCQGGNFNGFEILPVIDYKGGPKLNEGDVAIYTDDNGNIKITAGKNGKVFIGNDNKNICTLLTGLIDEIENITTAGSSTSHTIDTGTKTKLELYKNQVKQLFMENVSGDST